MSTDRELTRIVRSWLQTDEHESAERVLDSVIDRLDTTPQRRPLGRAWRESLMNSTLRFAAAGAVVLVIAAIALAVYFSRPAVTPATSPSPGQSPSITVAATPVVIPPSGTPVGTTQPTGPAAERAPFIVFLHAPVGTGLITHADLWAIRADGTDAQEIFPDIGTPSVAWSRDGTRLLVIPQFGLGASHIYVAEVSDAIGPLVDTGATTNEGSRDFAFAPDGQRVVFVLADYVIAVLDLRTGELTELTETVQGFSNPLARPAWSADGSQIAFVREQDNRQPGGGDSGLVVMNADGSNLRPLELGGLSVTGPRWSSDGNRIAVHGIDLASASLETNIYSFHPDGTDRKRLTNDGHSSLPQWTASDQIMFRRGRTELDTLVTSFWLMDADGGNPTQLFDLRTAFDAIEPRGSVQDVFVPGDPAGSYSWQSETLEPSPSTTPSPIAVVEGPLAGGRYSTAVGPAGGGTQRIRIDLTLPEGWTASNVSSAEVSLTGSDGLTGYPHLGFFVVRRVYIDPCHPEDGYAGGGVGGPPPDGIADELRSLAGFDAGPTSIVTIDGLPFTHFVITNDIDTEVAGCTDGALLPLFMTLEANQQTEQFVRNHSPATNGGTAQEVWIVNGEWYGPPLLIVGELSEDDPEGDRAAIEQILSSISLACGELRPASCDANPYLPTQEPELTVEFAPPFSYAIPAAINSPWFKDATAMYGLVDPAPEGLATESAYGGAQALSSRGIAVVSVDALWVGVCRGLEQGRVQMRTAPTEWLEDLQAVVGLNVGPITSSVVDERPALTADITPGTSACTPDLDFSRTFSMGEEYLVSDVPARLFVVDVDGNTVLVDVWAETDAQLATWLPTAQQFVDSIHFIGLP